ncbi:MAG: glycoside hydrolase family 127 protein, partial [Lachnospiraceae bacterium]|nr:glycoside hydrolase family 127 protein [Lachnospiraceae bacterium]
VAKRCAENIRDHFGPEEGKIHGYDGHEEIEIGLLRLYHVTGNEDHLQLAKYFLLERGKHPEFFREQAATYDGPDALGGIEKSPDTYFQNHKPVMEMDTAEGHAVRVVYLCTALADLAATTEDPEIYEVCKRFWNNITKKRMFITGGIGSTVKGESFTLDYDLPNDTMYCETCAAVGMVFFARQMLRIEPKAEYAEVMERSLYNCALAGMALDGKHFFYVNPLEVNVKKFKLDPTKSHVKAIRPSWLGCACCPPNLARLLASLDDYVYTVREDAVLLNLFVGSDATISIDEERALEIQQRTEFPWEDALALTITNRGEEPEQIGIRIPSWAEGTILEVAGNKQEVTTKDGYQYLVVAAGESVEVRLSFTVSVRRNYSNLHVSEDAGKVALSRGPFVYCLEEVDNGEELYRLELPEDGKVSYEYEPDLLGGVGTILASGKRLVEEETDELYGHAKPKETEVQLKYIPYYAWANRGENDMQVWIRER